MRLNKRLIDIIMSDAPSVKKDDAEQAAYEEAYNRIEAQIVAENVADGADEATFKADGAQVHQRVMKELSERKHCED